MATDEVIVDEDVQSQDTQTSFWRSLAADFESLQWERVEKPPAAR